MVWLSSFQSLIIWTRKSSVIVFKSPISLVTFLICWVYLKCINLKKYPLTHRNQTQITLKSWRKRQDCGSTIVFEYCSLLLGLLGKFVEPIRGRAPLEEVSVGRAWFNSTTPLLVYYVFPDFGCNMTATPGMCLYAFPPLINCTTFQTVAEITPSFSRLSQACILSQLQEK